MFFFIHFENTVDFNEAEDNKKENIKNFGNYEKKNQRHIHSVTIRMSSVW